MVVLRNLHSALRVFGTASDYEFGFRLAIIPTWKMDSSGSYYTSDIALNTLKSLYPKKDGFFRVKVDTNDFNSDKTLLGSSTSELIFPCRD